jgi:hypothetical protein
MQLDSIAIGCISFFPFSFSYIWQDEKTVLPFYYGVTVLHHVTLFRPIISLLDRSFTVYDLGRRRPAACIRPTSSCWPAAAAAAASAAAALQPST